MDDKPANQSTSRAEYRLFRNLLLREIEGLSDPAAYSDQLKSLRDKILRETEPLSSPAACSEQLKNLWEKNAPNWLVDPAACVQLQRFCGFRGSNEQFYDLMTGITGEHMRYTAWDPAQGSLRTRFEAPLKQALSKEIAKQHRGGRGTSLEALQDKSRENGAGWEPSNEDAQAPITRSASQAKRAEICEWARILRVSDDNEVRRFVESGDVGGYAKDKATEAEQYLLRKFVAIVPDEATRAKLADVKTFVDLRAAAPELMSSMDTFREAKQLSGFNLNTYRGGVERWLNESKATRAEVKQAVEAFELAVDDSIPVDTRYRADLVALRPRFGVGLGQPFNADEAAEQAKEMLRCVAGVIRETGQGDADEVRDAKAFSRFLLVKIESATWRTTNAVTLFRNAHREFFADQELRETYAQRPDPTPEIPNAIKPAPRVGLATVEEALELAQRENKFLAKNPNYKTVAAEIDGAIAKGFYGADERDERIAAELRGKVLSKAEREELSRMCTAARVSLPTVLRFASLAQARSWLETKNWQELQAHAEGYREWTADREKLLSDRSWHETASGELQATLLAAEQGDALAVRSLRQLRTQAMEAKLDQFRTQALTQQPSKRPEKTKLPSKDQFSLFAAAEQNASSTNTPTFSDQQIEAAVAAFGQTKQPEVTRTTEPQVDLL